MPDVDEAIQKYNGVFDQLKDTISKKDRIINKQAEELDKVKGELHKMQLEMAMLELPDMNHVQERIILDQFRDSKGVKEVPGRPQPTARAQAAPAIEIPIIGGDDEEVATAPRGKSPFEIVE